METLNTITNNAVILWNSPVDWSPTGGMIWLMPMLAIFFISFVVFCINEAKDERKALKAKIYRAAEESGRVHLQMKSQKGYLERRNF